jgi:WD40 repeat protein
LCAATPWDLRKLKNFKSIQPWGEGGAETSSVAFDHSGHYLAVGGGDARVYDVKVRGGLYKLPERSCLVKAHMKAQATSSQVTSSQVTSSQVTSSQVTSSQVVLKAPGFNPWTLLAPVM